MRNEIMILDRIRCEKALQVDNFVPAWLTLLALLSLLTQWHMCNCCMVGCVYCHMVIALQK